MENKRSSSSVIRIYWEQVGVLKHLLLIFVCLFTCKNMIGIA